MCANEDEEATKLHFYIIFSFTSVWDELKEHLKNKYEKKIMQR